MVKNKWLIGVGIVAVIVVIFVIFNYQGPQSQDGSLNDIFPEDSTGVPETEYEFVTDGPAKQAEVKPVAPKVQATKQAAAPAAVSAPAPVAVSAVSGSYSIQVLSSKDKAATEKTLEKIKGKGHAAYIVTKDLGDKGIWYRINVGSYATKAQAESALSSVKADYKDSFIVYVK